MIYFAQPTDGGQIRIGSSSAPNIRKKQLGTWLPQGVELVAVIGGGVLGEAIIHRCFDPVRVKPGGKDWFRSCPVLWKFIISASEHGRPDWLPAESDRVIFKLDDLVDEFGAFQKIVPLLGYSNELYFMQALKWQTKNGYVLQARVEFLRLLRDGMLPSYIANMHEDLLEALRPSREAKRAAA